MRIPADHFEEACKLLGVDLVQEADHFRGGLRGLEFTTFADEGRGSLYLFFNLGAIMHSANVLVYLHMLNANAMGQLADAGIVWCLSPILEEPMAVLTLEPEEGVTSHLLAQRLEKAISALERWRQTLPPNTLVPRFQSALETALQDDRERSLQGPQ